MQTSIVLLLFVIPGSLFFFAFQRFANRIPRATLDRTLLDYFVVGSLIVGTVACFYGISPSYLLGLSTTTTTPVTSPDVTWGQIFNVLLLAFFSGALCGLVWEGSKQGWGGLGFRGDHTVFLYTMKRLGNSWCDFYMKDGTIIRGYLAFCASEQSDTDILVNAHHVLKFGEDEKFISEYFPNPNSNANSKPQEIQGETETLILIPLSEIVRIEGTTAVPTESWPTQVSKRFISWTWQSVVKGFLGVRNSKGTPKPTTPFHPQPRSPDYKNLGEEYL